MSLSKVLELGSSKGQICPPDPQVIPVFQVHRTCTLYGTLLLCPTKYK